MYNKLPYVHLDMIIYLLLVTRHHFLQTSMQSWNTMEHKRTLHGSSWLSFFSIFQFLLTFHHNKANITTSAMTINYIGLVVLIIGGLFLLMAIIQPKNFIVYKGLIARSELCWGEGNGPKFMMAYSLMMIVFGALLMFRVFGKQEEKED